MSDSSLHDDDEEEADEEEEDEDDEEVDVVRESSLHGEGMEVAIWEGKSVAEYVVAVVV